jgi:EpsD family peptidyl-prolyl cis-trans isomerase
MEQPFATAGVLFCITTLAGLLGGCGSSAMGGASQVVAKVNGREITVSQLRRKLSSAQLQAPSEGDVGNVLDRLIDEELLVQAANRERLESDPELQRKYDAITRRVLASAYEGTLVQSVQPPTEEEVHKFYDDNPALFSKRRIFNAVDFETNVSSLDAELSQDILSVHSADAVRNLLRDHAISFESSDVSFAPESLPLSLLNKLGDASKGDVIFATNPSDDVRLLYIKDAASDPIAFGKSKEIIPRYLQARQSEELLAAELTKLKAAASIEYFN